MSVPPPASPDPNRPDPNRPDPNRPDPNAPASWPPPPGGYAPPGYAPPPSTGGGLGRMIPSGNPSALTAYYLGIFSIIPCLAIPMGIAAVVLGLRGLKLAKERPEVHGRTHAWVGIIAGGLFAMINIAGIVFAVVAASSQHGGG